MRVDICGRCEHETAEKFSEYCSTCYLGSKFEAKHNASRHDEIDALCYGYYTHEAIKRKRVQDTLRNRLPEIKDVIFNDPATIVFWGDGTKTVVKVRSGDNFDKEKGLAMAITKKALGNTGKYYETIKEWID